MLSDVRILESEYCNHRGNQDPEQDATDELRSNGRAMPLKGNQSRYGGFGSCECVSEGHGVRMLFPIVGAIFSRQEGVKNRRGGRPMGGLGATDRLHILLHLHALVAEKCREVIGGGSGSPQ